MKRSLVSLAMVFCLLGCVTSNDSIQTERTKLIKAKSRWENAMTANVSGYVFTSRSSCECAFTAPFRIGVSNDSIKSIIEITNQNVMGDSVYTYFRTINKWYSWIANTLDANPYVLTVEYDSVLGYPRKIIYDGNSKIIDDELTHTNDSLSLIYRIVM